VALAAGSGRQSWSMSVPFWEWGVLYPYPRVFLAKSAEIIDSYRLTRKLGLKRVRKLLILNDGINAQERTSVRNTFLVLLKFGSGK
jgi:hypothetical protein